MRRCQAWEHPVAWLGIGLTSTVASLPLPNCSSRGVSAHPGPDGRHAKRANSSTLQKKTHTNIERRRGASTRREAVGLKIRDLQNLARLGVIFNTVSPSLGGRLSREGYSYNVPSNPQQKGQTAFVRQAENLTIIHERQSQSRWY